MGTENNQKEGATQKQKGFGELLTEALRSGEYGRAIYRNAQPDLEAQREMETASKAASKNSRAL